MEDIVRMRAPKKASAIYSALIMNVLTIIILLWHFASNTHKQRVRQDNFLQPPFCPIKSLYNSRNYISKPISNRSIYKVHDTSGDLHFSQNSNFTSIFVQLSEISQQIRAFWAVMISKVFFVGHLSKPFMID